MIGATAVQSLTGETHKHVGRYIKVSRFLPCLRRSKGLSTRLHRVSQSRQLARPLLQVQPLNLHNELHFDFDFSRVMLMCLLVTQSRCISLETHLVLNSDYIKQFSFCVCVLLLSLLMFPAD